MSLPHSFLTGKGLKLEIPAVPAGQQAYTSSGTYTFIAPGGWSSVSVVCIGGGAYLNAAAGFFYGAGGGALSYANNIPVTPGDSYTVRVGTQGATYGNNGQSSYFTSNVCEAGGGATPDPGNDTVGAGGTVIHGTGGAGGAGGGCTRTAQYDWSAGGGAGGYSGTGGAGASNTDTNGASGSGGGGGGGYGVSGAFGSSGCGGGTGILGEGSSGAGGVSGSGRGGGGGSGGQAGWPTGNGTYGSGAGREEGTHGAVRIIWGEGRSFPSTNTGDV